MKNTALILAMTAAFGTFNFAHAEGPDPAALKGMYDTGRNMSGLINHCVDKGLAVSRSKCNSQLMI